MKKIQTIFERDWDGDRSRVLNQPTPGCEWVFEGFGVPTRKWDGTCVMFNGTSWWARREVKEGKEAPPNYVAVTDPDPETGKVSGWEPIDQSPFYEFFNEAMDGEYEGVDPWPIGTYELVGPKINDNPEKLTEHELIAHSRAKEIICPDRQFETIKAVIEANKIEGIVFHHADGRMAKIKGRDLGLKRNV